MLCAYRSTLAADGADQKKVLALLREKAKARARRFTLLACITREAATPTGSNLLALFAIVPEAVVHEYIIAFLC